MKFIVIGITDNREQHFAPEVMECIRWGHVFSGGKRHHELLRHLLPADHVWIEVMAPLNAVFKQYVVQCVIVFASGDPLFYGYATTLRREFPDAEIEVYPTFNSLQLLAHKMLLSYQDMKCVSVTGRDWKGLDDALIAGEKLIGCLTDKNKTPHLIAQRMLEYGYDNYTVSIGECLGNPDKERVGTYALYEVPADVQEPNCIVLQQIAPRKRYFGIPEGEFHLLDGRVNMITKAPIRLLTLSALDLPKRRVLWDIGFCTGSVSVEARLQFPHLQIESFEIRPEGEQLMALNSRKFGAPGIQVHIGDFLSLPLADISRPDAVFIGGHGGKLPEMMSRVREYLLPGGVVVFNSVSEQSRQLFCEVVGDCKTMNLALDDHNPICILTAELNTFDTNSPAVEVRKEGHVEFVGAGPGDPELISVKGKHFLEQADLILYAGSLVPERLTHYAKSTCVVRSSASMNLEEQYCLMKEFYDRGLLVVRLHTGDPCLYGAIQEQMALFDQAGMHYHITPGISAFQAAAAALHSQFTIPEKVQTIILTRGEGRTPMPEKEQLHRLAQSQSTMCIYLSAAIAEDVQRELLQAYPPTTPVAACYKLTWPEEKIYRGELKDLAKIVRENHLTLTTLLVVGEAIDNREGLSRLYAEEFIHLFRG